MCPLAALMFTRLLYADDHALHNAARWIAERYLEHMASCPDCRGAEEK